MRTLILYTSASGHTQKYAEDLASKVDADVFSLKKFKWKTLKDYGCVVFGGWVRGGVIMGLNDFLAHYDEMDGQDIIVFANGMSFPSKKGRDDLISANILDLYHVRFYQIRGSFDFSKLSFFNKLLMSNSLRSIANDPNATADQKMLLDIKNHPMEYDDVEGIEKIASVIRKIDVERKIVDA